MGGIPAAVRVSGIYAIFGAAWILSSDWLTSHVLSADLIGEAQTVKGLLFIAVTALLVHWLVARAVRDLRRSEAQVRDLFTSGPDALFIISEAGRILDANQVAVERHGRTREELCQLDYVDLVVPDLRERVLLKMRDLGDECARWESQHIISDGSEIPVEIRARAIERNGRRCILNSVRDVSERIRIDRALRETEERHGQLIELLHVTGNMAKVGGWEFDTQTLRGTWTDEVARIHDLNPCAASSVNLGLSFYRGESKAKIEKAIHDATELGEPYDLELELVSAKGVHKWVRTVGQPIWQDGKVVKVRGTFQDITERRRIEEQLRRRVANLQILNDLNSVFLSTTDLVSAIEQVYRLFPQVLSRFGVHRASVLLYDRETNSLISDDLIGVERAAEELWSAPQPIGHSISGKCFQERRPITIANCAESDMIPPDVVERLGLKSTVAVPIMFQDQPLGVLRLDNTLEPAGFSEEDVALFALVGGHLGIVIRSAQLITERLHAERALAQTDVKLRVAVDAANIGLWDWNLVTNKVYFSPEWKRQIGYEDHEISDEYNEWESRVHPDDLPRTLHLVRAFIKSPWTKYEAEFRLRHRDGSYRWILARGSLARDSEGKPIHMVGCHLDISERREIEQQLRQSQKMEAIGQLAGGVAHDFNNLLLAIMGYCSMAAEGLEEGDERLECLKEIDLATERAAALTRQLLAFSRQQVMRRTSLNLNELIGGLMMMLRRLLPESCDIDFQPGSDVGTIFADKAQIEQVILNLCVNARDAMLGGGRITISTQRVALDADFCRVHSWAREDQFVCVTVVDTGVGMTPEIRERIFEPFFTTKEQGKGTGLGLAMVFGIVEQHEGLIDIESEPGEGTSVHIYLPLSNEDMTPQLGTETEEVRGGEETILIVEDEDNVRRLTTRLLERAGYSVLTACDGSQAVKVFRENRERVDIVLLDMVMPGMNGIEVSEVMRCVRPDVRILFTSGYSPAMSEYQELELGEIDLIAKPYEAKSLLRRIRANLDA